jgi:hypothetical protein
VALSLAVVGTKAFRGSLHNFTTCIRNEGAA